MAPHASSVPRRRYTDVVLAPCRACFDEHCRCSCSTCQRTRDLADLYASPDAAPPSTMRPRRWNGFILNGYLRVYRAIREWWSWHRVMSDPRNPREDRDYRAGLANTAIGRLALEVERRRLQLRKDYPVTKKETLDAAVIGGGCLGRSQDDEPVFVLCARDKTAPQSVRLWALHLQTHYGESEKVRSALALADQMEAWQKKHETAKVPD